MNKKKRKRVPSQKGYFATAHVLKFRLFFYDERRLHTFGRFDANQI